MWRSSKAGFPPEETGGGRTDEDRLVGGKRRKGIGINMRVYNGAHKLKKRSKAVGTAALCMRKALQLHLLRASASKMP